MKKIVNKIEGELMEIETLFKLAPSPRCNFLITNSFGKPIEFILFQDKAWLTSKVEWNICSATLGIIEESIYEADKFKKYLKCRIENGFNLFVFETNETKQMFELLAK